jgi:hypothetical protein
MTIDVHAHYMSPRAELRRARVELGLIGAIVPVNAFTSLAEAERLRPLFALANETGAHLFVHPGLRPDEFAPARPATPRFSDKAEARQALEVQARGAGAMVTLLFTDFLDAFPNVSVHIANLGGTLPAVVARMDHASHLRAPHEALPSGRMRRLHVDCASLGPRTKLNSQSPSSVPTRCSSARIARSSALTGRSRPSPEGCATASTSSLQAPMTPVPEPFRWWRL